MLSEFRQILCIGLIVCGISTWGLNVSGFEKEIVAKRTETPPMIDGKLDDLCWKNAIPVKNFTISNTDKPAQSSTITYVLYNDSAIYIGVMCKEKEISTIKKIDNLKKDSSDIFRCDCVEIMLDPENSKNDYFHIGINADGVIADRACTQGGFVGDMKWNGDFTAASFIGDKYWSCEIVIPFYTLGITPKVNSKWAINICREKQVPQELSSIAKNGDFNVAGHFSELTGLNVDFSQYLFDIGTPNITAIPDNKGLMNVAIKANITNNTGKDKEITLECGLISPAQKTSIYRKKEIVKNGTVKDFTLNKIILAEQGEYTCQLRIVDPITKKTYVLKKFPLLIKYTPVTISLIAPWYRNSIFETQNIQEVIFDLSADAAVGDYLTAGIRKAGDNVAIISTELQTVSKINRVKFPAVKLPYGKLEIFSILKDSKGEILAEVKVPLNKLPRKNGEVWLGKNLKWHVDGKPFFMLGAWNYPEDFLPDYNAFTGEKPNCKLIDDTGLLPTVFYNCKNIRTQNPLSEEEKKILIEVIRKIKDKNNLVAYYLADEPEGNGINAKGLGEIYDLAAEEDPYHPIIVSNNSISGLKDYALCSDINGLHPYPVTLKNKSHNDISSVAVFVETAVKFFDQLAHKQTIAYLHQGFNYGDYGAANNRIPNYMEYRNQNLLALICGANGIIEYNRTVAHYPELYIGMPELTKELKYLGNIILAGNSKLAVKSSSKFIKSMVKEMNGNQYIFACNAQINPEDIEISIPGIEKTNLNVISESRAIVLSKDSFKDHFEPFEVHVYTTSGDNPNLTAVKEISDKINKANMTRKKDGNLAFQMFEGDGVKITASSNFASKYGMADTGLWHVVDGITDTKNDYDKNLAWHDNTPNEFPDWIEVQLPESTDINKVVVYPFDKSLKDYSVQAFVRGEWKDVDKVTGRKDDVIEHKFAVVNTSRIRLWITATNGKNSEVSEIEIYGGGK